jgi:hypothetical protein
MSAGTWVILLEKGADFILPMLFREQETKGIIDLTGCVLTLPVAAKQGGPTLFEIPVTISATPTDGTCVANYPKEDIDLLTIKEGWSNLYVTWSNGTVERLAEGRVVISKGVE